MNKRSDIGKIEELYSILAGQLRAEAYLSRRASDQVAFQVKAEYGRVDVEVRGTEIWELLRASVEAQVKETKAALVALNFDPEADLND